MPRSDLVRVKDRVPRNGKGADNLITQLGQYMRLPENKYVQKIIVDSQRPYIYIEKLLPKDQAPPEAGMTFHDAIRMVPMEEVSLDVHAVPLEFINEMFRMVARNGFEMGHILIGQKSSLYDWIKMPKASDRLFGTPLHKLGEIPDDVVIACGSRMRDCDPEDIEFSVKVAIP